MQLVQNALLRPVGDIHAHGEAPLSLSHLPKREPGQLPLFQRLPPPRGALRGGAPPLPGANVPRAQVCGLRHGGGAAEARDAESQGRQRPQAPRAASRTAARNRLPHRPRSAHRPPSKSAHACACKAYAWLCMHPSSVPCCRAADKTSRRSSALRGRRQ